MKKQLNSRRIIQIAITVLAILLLIVHWRWPSFNLDATTLILLILVVIPWVFPLFKSLEFPGGWKVEFQDQKEFEAVAKAKVAEEIKKTNASNQKKIKWDNVATLFWLGNDLMWVQDMTYRYASPERVLVGLNHCIEYAQDLGFGPNSLPVEELTLAKQVLLSLQGISPSTKEMMAFLESHYAGTRQHIQTVKWYIDALATQEQPNFKKKRAL